MDAALVRAQLMRMLASEIFTRSDRLSAFLRFVVEQTLDGHAAGLKEQSLGCQLYAKGTAFDGAADPIVRVDARRLRDKLREYYAEFPHDAVVITLPKGTYVPVFTSNGHVPPPAPPSRSGWPWVAAVIAAAGLLAAIITWTVVHRMSSVPDRLLRVTSFPGEIGAPALSPDGNFVAFSWKGPEANGAPDIWIKSIASGDLRRLTATPELSETAPAWSPDGGRIAFARRDHGIFVVPQLGGEERKVSGSGTHVGWAPDGTSVLIRHGERDGPFGIYQVSLDTLERRALTQPPSGVGDWRFNVSPDGTMLAFIRYERAGLGDLFVVPLAGGEPRRLTNLNAAINGVDWTPDGRDLSYSFGGLWCLPVRGTPSGGGSRMPGVPDSAKNPSVSRPRSGRPGRLAFQVENADVNFRIVDLQAPLNRGVFQAAKPFAAASRLDYPGTFSPDGGSLAFVSARGTAKPSLPNTSPELWLSRTDWNRLAAARHGSTSYRRHLVSRRKQDSVRRRCRRK